LAAALYVEGGIRSVEIGTLMFGKRDASGAEQAGPMDLLRLAIPRRVYTQSHIDYCVEVILEVWKRRDSIRGLRLVHQAPYLRHFSARLEQL
jgi:tryptophanase